MKAILAALVLVSSLAYARNQATAVDAAGNIYTGNGSNQPTANQDALISCEQANNYSPSAGCKLVN